ncbi:molecular chaperone DnaJ [Theileria orientalis strain Shintoku]|uniref:Molecular chaperone DnaJ n=1 Tax=Theileria orientalis strain Shintoku TaxID=869250 RepID=J4C7L1_THEOR|nr:LOW QUALITY PROTEIN: molecular chaperone DnaJ [Theileria orientalis strain Shintoku]BAM39228.1 molecular chaperone DnaJ [Theileria orientalis strain Shintoku]|eukprot:XP_009689529.1 LOW QUALITY PROTEIN: molecular chaperone DnaJ [Theileria orientalis strain Shintoku]
MFKTYYNILLELLDMKNYYTILGTFGARDLCLGVAKNATRLDIRKAYLQKAKLYHPDLNPSASAASKFKEIQEAYNTLYNPDKRREYDAGPSTFNSTHSHSGFYSSTANRYNTYDASRQYRSYTEAPYNSDSFEQQFRAETEWLRKQWQQMEEERFKNESANLRNLNSNFRFKLFDNFFNMPINWLRYFFYFINRILPTLLFPIGLVLYLTRDNSGHQPGRRKMQIVYDSYGIFVVFTKITQGGPTHLTLTAEDTGNFSFKDTFLRTPEFDRR